ncbi:MAG: hypothetical protein M1828_004984 [Chrysothrix sp. TS-e1954]|nr:MAG: hypothetical protein M1828_004984 [Chrysothrix sp. TS-e1954]
MLFKRPSVPVMSFGQDTAMDESSLVDIHPAFRSMSDSQLDTHTVRDVVSGSPAASREDADGTVKGTVRAKSGRPRSIRRIPSRGDWVSAQVKQIEARVNSRMSSRSRDVSPTGSKIFRPWTPTFRSCTPLGRPSPPTSRPSTPSANFRPSSAMKRRSVVTRISSPILPRLNTTDLRPSTRATSRETNSSDNSSHYDSSSPRTCSTPATQYSRASSRASSANGFLASLKRRSQRFRVQSLEHLHSSFKRSLSPTFVHSPTEEESEAQVMAAEQSEPSYDASGNSSSPRESHETDTRDDTPALEPSHRHLAHHEIRPSILGLLSSPECPSYESSIAPESPATPPASIFPDARLNKPEIVDEPHQDLSPAAPVCPPPITPTQVSHIWSHALVLLSTSSAGNGIQKPHHAALLESLHTFQSLLSAPSPPQISKVLVAAININIGLLMTRFPIPDFYLACESFSAAIHALPRGKLTTLASFALGCAMFDHGKVTEAADMWDMCESMLEEMGVVSTTPGGWGGTGWGAKPMSASSTPTILISASDGESETSTGFEDMGDSKSTWRLERSSVAANKSICKQRVRVEAFMKSEVKWEIQRIPENFMLDAPDEQGNYVNPQPMSYDRSSVELRIVETYSLPDDQMITEAFEDDLHAYLQPVIEESCPPSPELIQKENTPRPIIFPSPPTAPLPLSPAPMKQREASPPVRPLRKLSPPRTAPIIAHRRTSSKQHSRSPPKHSPESIACSSFYSHYTPLRDPTTTATASIGLGVALENHPALRMTRRPLTRKGEMDLNKPLPPLPLQYPRLSRVHNHDRPRSGGLRTAPPAQPGYKMANRAPPTNALKRGTSNPVEAEKARIARKARKDRKNHESAPAPAHSPAKASPRAHRHEHRHRNYSPVRGFSSHRERRGTGASNRRPKSITSLRAQQELLPSSVFPMPPARSSRRRNPNPPATATATAMGEDEDETVAGAEVFVRRDGAGAEGWRVPVEWV